MAKRLYTTKEKEFIRANALTMDVIDIADALPGRTPDGIISYLTARNIPRKMTRTAGAKRKVLTPEQQKFIQDNCKKMNASRLKSHLKLSFPVIAKYIEESGLERCTAYHKDKEPVIIDKPIIRFKEDKERVPIVRPPAIYSNTDFSRMYV